MLQLEKRTTGPLYVTERAKVTTEEDLSKYPRYEGFECNGGTNVTNEKDRDEAGPTKF